MSESDAGEGASVLDQLDLDGEVNEVTVRFEGLRRVDSKVLYSECHPIFEARTVGELLAKVVQAQNTFNSFGLFRRQSVELSTPQGGARGDVEVTFHVEEQKYDIAVGVQMDHRRKPTMELTATIPSVFSTLQSFSLKSSYTNSKSHEILGRLSFPRLFGRYLMNTKWFGELSGGVTFSDYSRFSSYREKLLPLDFRVRSQDGRQAVGLHLGLRDILPDKDAGRSASYAVLCSRLRSLKSSVKYEYTDDRTQDVAAGGMPVDGHTRHMALEYAGLLGDVRYVRAEAGLSFYRSLLPDRDRLVLNASVSGGALYPIGTDASPIQDRFYLGEGAGAPTYLKGFAYRGVGPADPCICPKPGSSLVAPAAAAAAGESKGGKAISTKLRREYDYVGGNVFYGASALLSYLPPFNVTQNIGLRVIGFTQAGNVVEDLSRASLSRLFQETRVSSGVGFTVPLPVIPGVLEVTYAWPWRRYTSDALEKFQIGVRLRLPGAR
ncbi:unnamed protein product [Vitrella brassicaformis CCMP3155]|uniref:Bacterial surface antigen (D15) domain-containing protein n=1 Tax=Vitrella brassicaformis (strain CCMP3155) TaxID=1169540 RepID=A0A0G4GXS5_VITBC|nr:unnamed protein product [Vitrella brassicaformis CCMP3155]|mmetsp:Transcript_19700/g.56524  ORF Transcript_19700/g.56524 Transcript_19700/m.56524 type:complete len:493 (+) Transcript_19700:117-1595(+)|eukprot:CEM35654.1 unnamed protein product [Vitrella brassicaformis CCMP3155]